jgi:hypothetical protein
LIADIDLQVLQANPIQTGFLPVTAFVSHVDCCLLICSGMTNRKDMIDDALLRPGRLEVQMEIGNLHFLRELWIGFRHVKFIPKSLPLILLRVWKEIYNE